MTSVHSNLYEGDDFFDLSSSASTSTITERRDDSLLPTALDDIVLSSLHSLHFVLSPTTTILRVSTNCLSILGCEPNLLLGQRLAALIHRDDARVFNTEIHDALRSSPSSPFRFHCRIRSVVTADRTHSAFELLGHYQVTPPATLSPLQLMMPPPGIFSITARPAVTRKGQELDGILELKVEQIRLMRRIEDLQRQEAAEVDDDESSPRGRESTDSSRSSRIDISSSSKPPRSRSSPPRTSAESPAAKAKLSGSPSKAEMGDIGIPFLLRSRDSYSSTSSQDKERLTKRKFLGREYRCSRCGRTDSPEWRRGPDGPKTLCNACGLTYSKAKRRAEKLEQSKTVSQGSQDSDMQMAHSPSIKKLCRY